MSTVIDCRGVIACLHTTEDPGCRRFDGDRCITGDVAEIPGANENELYHKSLSRWVGVLHLINWAVGKDYL